MATRRPDVSLLLAHDLRTPLSTMAMNLEYLLSEVATLSPEARAAIEDCVAANAHAVRIVSDMAEAARVARTTLTSEAEPTDVQALVGEAARNLGVPIAARRLHVIQRGEPTLTRTDPALLGRAIERLLEWLLRHAEPGATVHLTCEERVVSMRARMGTKTGARDTHASLATHYADTILRAQGGGVWTEVDDQQQLCITAAIPR